MDKRERVVERYVAFILRHRVLSLLLIGAITGFFCYQTLRLRIVTDFISFYPPRHPYIQLYKQYRKMFGSANVLVCAVEVKKGDIYNWETMKKVDRITQEMMTIKGCNPTQLISITHPKLKDVRVSAWGITIQPLLNRGITRDEGGMAVFKQAIYTNAGVRGFYVALNDKAASIFAGFWEEGVDPLKLYERLEQIREKEEDGNHAIHFTGFPALYAYIYHLAPQVYRILGITALVMIGLLYYYFRTWQGVFVPVLSAAVGGLWGLGFARTLGYTLDPLILVVPLIITARAISHSVQCLSRYHEEYVTLGDKREAIIRGYGELFAPAALSIATDALGLLLISVVTIPLMRNLGFFGSFWIVSLVVAVPTLNPIVLSLIGAPDPSKVKREVRGSFYTWFARLLVRPSQGRGRWVLLALAVIVLIVGGNYARKLKVGNTEAGAAVLYADHPYNLSFRYFNTNFVGATQLVIIVEGKQEGAIKDYQTLRSMEDFQRYMEREAGAGGTLTFTNMIKRVYRMFHEGNPKWEMLPKKPQHLGQVGSMIRNNAAPGELDQWIDYEWTNATITCFYKEYNNELIKRSIAKAKEFIDTHPSEKVSYRLAGGLIGVLAAVNEEVEYSYWVSLLVVFAACFVMCVATFRSFMAGVILIIPLAISQVMSEVFMVAKGIDLNINSLPVAAIAVGIGIDYGIYLLARVSEEYRRSRDFQAANLEAVETTGKAIIFTATTLIAGVVFWVFSDLKFQAEMGILLALLMFLNMANSMLLIPSLVAIFRPRFVSEKKL
ncbi:MAG: MMPL family transporter [Acidobacteriota bacterium]